jgi:hypothetical protein
VCIGARRFVSAVNYSEVLTRLKLPDAYALATAIHAEQRGHADVRLESFDVRVIKAYTNLPPLSADLG